MHFGQSFGILPSRRPVKVPRRFLPQGLMRTLIVVVLAEGFKSLLLLL
jgi:hypothetical protein